MTCSRCGGANRVGRRFCAECGAALALQCSQCSAENQPGEKFCGECGATLRVSGAGLQGSGPSTPPSAPDPRTYTPKHLADTILTTRSAPEGERKQVTVLFADVKGSMELAEQVHPGEWQQILDRTLEDTLPYVFALLGIADPTSALPQMDSQLRRWRTLDAVMRIRVRETLDQPPTLICEGLHWFDGETQAFLDLLEVGDNYISPSCCLIEGCYQKSAPESHQGVLETIGLGGVIHKLTLRAMGGEAIDLTPGPHKLVGNSEGWRGGAANVDGRRPTRPRGALH